MSWLKRFRRAASHRNRRFPQRQFGPVDEIVEQGLLVADVAVRMTVKNAIIMNALKRHVDYDEHQIVEMVREAVIEVADERAEDARHIGEILDEIRERGYSSWMDADFSGSDGRTLRHRQQVYSGVAEKLHERARDEQYLQRTAERARQAAWSEIGDSLKERASQPYYGGGHTPEYERARESRIQEFIDNELSELIVERGDGTAQP